MKPFSRHLLLAQLFVLLLPFANKLYAQCNAVVNTTARESRCKATGEISITVTGGSGNYNYKVTSGSFSTVTSSNTIQGLQAGTYSIEVKDLNYGCVYTQNNILVGGDYQDPRFQLNISDVTCINGNDGSLTVINQQYGRGPFVYTIVAPSVSQVGMSNTTGVFNNLVPGDYYVRLTDSCGGMQTRAVTVANYNWWIDASSVTKLGCDQATATITLRDSKGNTNTSGTTFNGYTYGVVRSAGDTSWYATRTYTFYKGTLRSVQLVVKDGCGNIKTTPWVDNAKPAVAGSVSISNQACSDFRATVTGQQNLTNPEYCLYNSSNTLIACNTTGVFNAVPYGAYCITVRDNCYDTTIQRCFTVNQPVPAVAASVSTSNLGCNSFTATVTGQQNLTNPQYCLFDNNNIQIACNSTGVFNNIPYGSYCIRITDGCTGTVINRCFTRLAPLPAVGAAISITNRACSTFSATVTGQQNLNNAQYCIYTSTGTLIACNSTGVFNDLPYGNYCINVVNDPVCYDSTIVRCFSVTAPVPSVGASVSISNQTCNDFRASITGQQNLNNPNYCLYDNNNNLIACNTTGQFSNLAYGSYCIRIANNAACYDTVIQRCFTVNRPVPSVAGTVSISNRTCSTFTASITGQTNLTNPVFRLYDNSNTLIATNSNGIFNAVPYGSYCIDVANTCYDTTIRRCFTANPVPMALNVNAVASCTIGTTDFNASWAATSGPYLVQVYNPAGALVRTANPSATNVSITGLTGLPAGLRYKVVITDQCNNRDSVLVLPNASWLNKTINANSKCPSGQWQNGSGDLSVFCQYSNGSVTPKIIRRDGAAVNITHNFNSGFNYTFSNMAPATYVVEYTLQGCSGKVYDTFNLAAYSYPNLDQSAIYQCNNNSFGVNAVVSSGLAPFTYEILGSAPTFPSIVAAPQTSPSFNINNGNAYSLVRLRAIDACGNATINDASILPLANTIVTASSNCFYNNITLTVDTIPNAVYTWYRKTSATDSVQIGTSQSYNIPYLLPTDTGTYVCKASVNSGCLTRVSSFHLNGMCGGFTLSESGFEFKGNIQNEKALLEWVTSKEFQANLFVVERSEDGRVFKSIGNVAANRNSTSSSRYMFSDNSLVPGANYYRIQVIGPGGQKSYSKVIRLERKAEREVSINPNPVNDHFVINFKSLPAGTYKISLVNTIGATIFNTTWQIAAGEKKMVARPAAAAPGNYFLLIQEQGSGKPHAIKLMLR
jgi:hypothetical protein